MVIHNTINQDFKMTDSFSQEIQGLTKNNPLPMLRKVAQLAPESMKQEVNIIKEGENSFFIKMLSNTRGEPEMQKQIIDFCKEQGYSFLTQTPKRTSAWPTLQNQPISDYLRAWESLSDTSLAYLTHLCGKEYLLQLEKQEVPLIAACYSKKLFKTLEILYEFGLDDNKHKGKISILELAKQNKENLDFYWKIKNKKDQNVDAFESKKDYFVKLLEYIRHVNSVDERYNINSITQFLDEELLKFKPQQQEQLIHECIQRPNLTPFKHALKLLGKTSKSYEPQTIPLWKSLGEKTNQDFFYILLDRKTPLDSQQGEDYYLQHIVTFLQGIRYDDSRNSYHSKRSEKARNQSIFERLEKLQDYDFWLTPNKNDNNHPWFYTACKIPGLINRFPNSWFNINPDKFNVYKSENQKKAYPGAIYEEKFVSSLENPVWEKGIVGLGADILIPNNQEIMKELMKRTWFYKDEKGKYAFEYYMEKSSLSEKLWVEYIRVDKEVNFIPLEGKIALFNHALKSWSSYENNWRIILSESMEKSGLLHLATLPENEHTIKAINKSVPDLYTKLRHAKLYKNLNENLNDAQKDTAKKMKI